jgi:O-antigen/teichoic acid export membrane protein
VGFQIFRRRLLGQLSHGIVKGSYVSILSQALVSGSNFLTGIIIAKATGVSEFGVFSLIAATVLGLQGIQQALITGPLLFMSRGGEEDNDRTSQYFMLQVLLSAPLAVAAAIALGTFLHQWSASQLIGIAGAVFFLQMQEFSRARLYIALWARKVLVLDIANHGLRLTLLLLLWKLDYLTSSTAFLALALAGGITSFPVIRGLAPQTFRICVDVARKSFQYGQWLLLESVAHYLSVPLYLFLTAALLSHEATGGLNAAISLLNLPNVLVLGLMNLAVPMARQKLMNEGYEAWRSQLVSTGAVVIAVSVFLYAVISAFGSFLLVTVYSSEFAKYADIFPIVGAYYCFLAVDTVLAAAFRLAHAPQIGAMTKLWSSIITVSVAYPLISLWGLVGAAIGLVLTSATWLAIYALYIYKGALRSERVLEQRFQD